MLLLTKLTKRGVGAGNNCGWLKCTEPVFTILRCFTLQYTLHIKQSGRECLVSIVTNTLPAIQQILEDISPHQIQFSEEKNQFSIIRQAFGCVTTKTPSCNCSADIKHQTGRRNIPNHAIFAHYPGIRHPLEPSPLYYVSSVSVKLHLMTLNPISQRNVVNAGRGAPCIK